MRICTGDIVLAYVDGWDAVVELIEYDRNMGTPRGMWKVSVITAEHIYTSMQDNVEGFNSKGLELYRHIRKENISQVLVRS